MPFPAGGASWMRENMPWIAQYPIEQVWLPGSHDAGMVKGICQPNSILVSESNLATQTLNIYDQLLCGVRWFDIRPACLDGTSAGGQPIGEQWYCGHHSKVLGKWMGGLGLSLQTVIDQVNKFTNDNKELVVLTVSHVQANNNGGGIDNFEQRTKDLLEYMFNSIKNVYRPTALNPPTAGAFQEIINEKMNKFVGTDQCVVISTWALANDDGPLLPDATWDQLGIVRTKFNFRRNLQSLTVMQSALDVISRTSILELAETYQTRMLPLAPQMLMVELLGGVCQIDNVRDDVILNLCLAATRARWLALGNKWETVVTYGGRVSWDVRVTGYINDYLRDLRSWNSLNAPPRDIPGPSITNTFMQSDPAPGLVKSCVVYNGEKRFPNEEPFYFGRFEREGGTIDLATDIRDMNWGGVQLTSLAFSKGYFSVWKALLFQESYTPVNQLYNNFDPADGRSKDLLIKYLTRRGQGLRQRRLRDQVATDFSREVLSLTFGTKVPPAQAFENMYWRLDEFEKGPQYITNVTMGPGNGQPFDPQPGVWKAATILCEYKRYGVPNGPVVQEQNTAMEGEYLHVPVPVAPHPSSNVARPPISPS